MLVGGTVATGSGRRSGRRGPSSCPEGPATISAGPSGREHGLALLGAEAREIEHALLGIVGQLEPAQVERRVADPPARFGEGVRQEAADQGQVAPGVGAVAGKKLDGVGWRRSPGQHGVRGRVD